MFCPLRHFLVFLIVLINEMELLKDNFETYFKAGIYLIMDNQTVVKKSHQENTEDIRNYKAVVLSAVLTVLVSEISEMATSS